jgi:hypothetical protein
MPSVERARENNQVWEGILCRFAITSLSAEGSLTVAATTDF